MLIKNFAFSGIFAAIVLSAGASFAVDTVASTTFVQKGDLAVYNALDNKKADKEAVTDLSNDVGALTTALAQKQATLTAGANITIDGNTISATVPTKTSELTNDSEYQTAQQVQTAAQTAAAAATENMVDTTALNTTLADYAKTTDIPNVPTKVSDLTNDSGYITSNDIAGKADANNVYDKATVDQKLAEAAAGGTVDLSGYVKTADIDVVDEYDQTFE